MNDRLIEQVKAGNLAEVKRLLKEGADINYKSRFNIDKGGMRYEIESGTMTPLSAAIISGHLDIVKYLVEEAKPKAKLNDIYVEDNRNFYGDVLDSVSIHATTLSLFKAQKNNIAILKYLLNISPELKKDFIKHLCGKDIKSIFFRGFDIKLKLLLEDNVILTTLSRENLITLLHYVLKTKDNVLLTSMLQNPNLKLTHDDIHNVLMSTEDSGELWALAEQGAYLDSSTEKFDDIYFKIAELSDSNYHFSQLKTHMDVILHAAGKPLPKDFRLELNFPDRPYNSRVFRHKGRTALHTALLAGRFSIANDLLEAGANPNLPDLEGKTASDFLENSNNIPLKIGFLFNKLIHLIQVFKENSDYSLKEDKKDNKSNSEKWLTTKTEIQKEFEKHLAQILSLMDKSLFTESNASDEKSVIETSKSTLTFDKVKGYYLLDRIKTLLNKNAEFVKSIDITELHKLLYKILAGGHVSLSTDYIRSENVLRVSLPSTKRDEYSQKLENGCLIEHMIFGKIINEELLNKLLTEYTKGEVNKDLLKNLSNPSEFRRVLDDQRNQNIYAMNKELEERIKAGDLETVKKLLAKGLDINHIYNPYRYASREPYPLFIALQSGQMHIVKYFLDEANPKANLDIRDEWGRNPLHYAIEYGHIELVKYFLTLNLFQPKKSEENRPFSIFPTHEQQALMSAINYERLDILELLMNNNFFEQGAVYKVNRSVGEARYTLLEYAAVMDQRKSFQYLLDKFKPTANELCKTFMNILKKKHGERHYATIDYLFNFGFIDSSIKQDYEKNHSYSPDDFYKFYGDVNYFYIRIMQLFDKAEGKKTSEKLELNFPLNTRFIEKNGRTALHVALISGNIPFAIELLQAGASPYREDFDGATPAQFIETSNNNLLKAEFLFSKLKSILNVTKEKPSDFSVNPITQSTHSSTTQQKENKGDHKQSAESSLTSLSVDEKTETDSKKEYEACMSRFMKIIQELEDNATTLEQKNVKDKLCYNMIKLLMPSNDSPSLDPVRTYSLLNKIPIEDAKYKESQEMLYKLLASRQVLLVPDAVNPDNVCPMPTTTKLSAEQLKESKELELRCLIKYALSAGLENEPIAQYMTEYAMEDYKKIEGFSNLKDVNSILSFLDALRRDKTTLSKQLESEKTVNSDLLKKNTQLEEVINKQQAEIERLHALLKEHGIALPAPGTQGPKFF